ncbi:hypothetical protein ABK040_009828 [Willaertia magna]
MKRKENTSSLKNKLKKLKNNNTGSSNSSSSSGSSSTEKKNVKIQWCEFHNDQINGQENQQEELYQKKEEIRELTTKPEDCKTILQNSNEKKDSEQQSKEFLNWFLAPLTVDEFVSNFLEKKVVVIKRHDIFPNYYKDWYSLKEIQNCLETTKGLKYSYDLDLALYLNNKRFTLNPNKDENVDPDLVWSLFDKQKCSVRMLRPQEHSDFLLSALCHFEEYFGQGAGLNAYLTPKGGSQGFAPHYDDIEALLVQLEGKKHWRIYAPLDGAQFLNRFSSKNFTQEELEGYQVFDIILEPGDLLYICKGVIHQAVTTSEDEHSLHVTVSISHQTSWQNYLEKALPMALELATNENVAFRKALPIGYSEYMGTYNAERVMAEVENGVSSGEDAVRREQFIETCTQLMTEVIQYMPIDEAADEMVKQFLYDRHVVEGFSSLSKEKKEIKEDEAVDLTNKKIRLVTKKAARVMLSNPKKQQTTEDNEEGDEETFVICYATRNTRIYHEVELQELELDMIFLPAVEYIFESYPSFVNISELPSLSNEEQQSLAQQLIQEKIVILS